MEFYFGHFTDEGVQVHGFPFGMYELDSRGWQEGGLLGIHSPAGHHVKSTAGHHRSLSTLAAYRPQLYHKIVIVVKWGGGDKAGNYDEWFVPKTFITTTQVRLE